jgi:shikimate dehydrogenase
MFQFGLIGLPLGHSKSPDLFRHFFERDIPEFQAEYTLFPLEHIQDIAKLLKTYPNLKGFNVTIPYKKHIIPFISDFGEGVHETGVVNTVVVCPSDELGLPIKGYRLKGYNTDLIGFREMIKPHIRAGSEHALILGNGASASSIAFVFKQLGIKCSFAGRSRKSPKEWLFHELNEEIISNFPIIVNTTPVGQFPNTDATLPIPLDGINKGQLLIDLIYNPEETLFLQKGKLKGAATLNGKTMLEIQAEHAWRIWKSNL